MVNILYAVTAFVCSLVLIILPLRMKNNLSKEHPVDMAFLFLINWTAAFCMIDCIWGVLASSLVMNDTLLFAFSSVFHLCAGFAPLVWLNYVLVYLGEIKHAKLYRILVIALYLVQIVLLVVNCFNHMMFYVDAAGIYCSTPVRRLLFYMQYITYVLIALGSTVGFIQSKKTDEKENGRISTQSYLYVILFVAAPILTGVFQMIFPDAPAYSIGYMLGCCIIYSFAVTDMLNERMIEKAVAQASSRAKTEFLFSMSHDIRTPMNAILGYTEIGLRHVDDAEKSKDSYMKIKSAGGHLLNLINDILEMSRIESGKLELSEKPLDIRALSKNIHYMSESLAAPKGIDLKIEVGELKNPYLYADELHVSEIIINLISNAVKYTPEGGSVTYCVDQISDVTDGKVTYRFEVADNGIGMSEEFQRHLFEAFSREQTSTVSKIEGTGLGLSIVRKIVDLSGGSIRVKSRQKVGSTFTVELPFRVMDDASVEEFRTTAVSDDGLAEDISLVGRKVLLVEDNEMNREIAAEILEEAGLIVETAEDGELAVRDILDKGSGYYDFILMDIQMPVMDGYEATKAIRALPNGDRVPIIALSANAFAEDKKKSLEAGMDDHVAKPVNIKELFGVLARFMK